jgi:hypothetical protein
MPLNFGDMFCRVRNPKNRKKRQKNSPPLKNFQGFPSQIKICQGPKKGKAQEGKEKRHKEGKHKQEETQARRNRSKKEKQEEAEARKKNISHPQSRRRRRTFPIPKKKNIPNPKEEEHPSAKEKSKHKQKSKHKEKASPMQKIQSQGKNPSTSKNPYFKKSTIFHNVSKNSKNHRKSYIFIIFYKNCHSKKS